MIIPTFQYFIKDNELSISDISRDTGLTRPTISALINKHNNGIRFDTINLICATYNLTIDDLFIFLPFESIVIDSDKQTITFTLYKEHKTKKIVKYVNSTYPSITETFNLIEIEKNTLLTYQKILSDLTDKQVDALTFYFFYAFDEIIGSTFLKMSTIDLLEYINR